ncbi:MAG: hypothetical protein NUV81_04140 [bacterium]|nr:hypothetical protein [bacterium]
MSDFFLDLQNRNRVIDFLVTFLPLVMPAKERARMEKYVRDAEADETRFSQLELMDTVRDLAVRVWSARYAVATYIQEHPNTEWDVIEPILTPQTKAHITRLRSTYAEPTFESFLHRNEVDAVLDEAEKLELKNVLQESHLVIWKTRGEEMKEALKKGDALREAFQERMEMLRGLGSELEESLQKEVYSKVTHFEDRFLFEGEIVPIEILDEEIAYYREQKEISPLED